MFCKRQEAKGNREKFSVSSLFISFFLSINLLYVSYRTCFSSRENCESRKHGLIRLRNFKLSQGRILNELERARLGVEETQKTIASARETIGKAQAVLEAGELRLAETVEEKSCHHAVILAEETRQWELKMWKLK